MILTGSLIYCMYIQSNLFTKILISLNTLVNILALILNHLINVLILIRNFVYKYYKWNVYNLPALKKRRVDDLDE